MVCSVATLMAAKANKKISITVGAETRSYWLYVPSNVKADAPLVISMHGTGGSCTDKAPFRTDVSDKYGCIVAYPQGENMTFPAFGNATLPGWHSTGVYTKDIDFLKAIIDDVDQQYSVDRKRIYCCGFSNGGMMTYTVANVCSDIFAAFASISGFPLNEFHLHHTSVRPFPFLHIHGKADDFVKYSLMPTIVDNIVARNGCNPVPVVKTVSGKYKKSVYEATEGSFPYVYYEVDGMGHNDFTANTEDGNSAITMWKFFSQYTLDTERDETLRWRPNIEQEGWVPKSHGWTIAPTGTTVLQFGKDQKTDANQNVYRSLQFETGKYKLLLHAEGPEGKTVKVRISKLTGTKKAVLDELVPIGQDAMLVFEVTDGWGEYKLAITHDKADGEVAFSGLAIHTATDEEFTSVTSMRQTVADGTAYDLLGRRVMASPVNGLLIKGGKKVMK